MWSPRSDAAAARGSWRLREVEEEADLVDASPRAVTGADFRSAHAAEQPPQPYFKQHAGGGALAGDAACGGGDAARPSGFGGGDGKTGSKRFLADEVSYGTADVTHGTALTAAGFPAPSYSCSFAAGPSYTRAGAGAGDADDEVSSCAQPAKRAALDPSAAAAGAPRVKPSPPPLPRHALFSPTRAVKPPRAPWLEVVMEELEHHVVLLLPAAPPPPPSAAAADDDDSAADDSDEEDDSGSDWEDGDARYYGAPAGGSMLPQLRLEELPDLPDAETAPVARPNSPEP